MPSSSSARSSAGFRVRVDTALLKRVIANTPYRLDTILRMTAEQIVGDIKLSMGESPPGRSYRRRSVVHVASQPGFPPNPDTGALRASIRWEKLGRNRYVVQDGVEYGVHLELGTSRVAPRPFITPVIKDWQQSKFSDLIKGLYREV